MMRSLELLKTGLLGGAFLLSAACSQSQSETMEALPAGYFSAEQVRSDFTSLYDGLKSAHIDLYVHRDKRSYDALYNTTLASFEKPLSHVETQTAFQKFAAFGKIGHSRIDFPNEAYSNYRANEGKSFPVYVTFKDGRPFVSENYSGVDAVKPGMELISVNGILANDFMLSLEQHISADTRYMAHSILGFTLPQYIWLEYGALEEFALELKDPKLGIIKVDIPGQPRAYIEAALENAPKSFDLSSHERVSKILDGNIGYLRPGPFYDYEAADNPWNNESFSHFIDEAFLSYLKADVKELIIDLRLNPGGDNSFSDLMIAWFADEPFSFASEFIVRSSPEAQASNQARLDTNPGSSEGVSGIYAAEYKNTPFGQNFNFEIPKAKPRNGEQFEGEVFVIIDRNSYSNAVNVAAIIQDYGMGIIMGEKTSDMATTFGAMETFTLPETGLSVGFPKAHIIRPSGERQIDGVAPDIAIETPVKPGVNDVVLETAIDIIGG